MTTIFLLAYLYVHCVILLSMVMHMHLMNVFGKWLIEFLCIFSSYHLFISVSAK